MKVMIVEDQESKRVTLVADLTQAGHTVQAVATGEQAAQALEREVVDVVITDLKLPGMDGLELLRWIKNDLAPATEVIMMTGYGTIPLAVEAIRRGAVDFITKPFDNRQIIPLLSRIEQKVARKELSGERIPSGKAIEIEKVFIGQSSPMRHLKHLIRVCAESDSNVLLCGETGTGKDLIASVIHKLSRRHSFPFVKVSCAVFPEALVENELFGHERGAFTGADQRKSGRIELAQQGTLYLDDVDDIPLKQQVKLLRIIEEKIFERVGSSTQIQCDVRFIASTKVDLTLKIAEGLFREDLYYRLKILELHQPPLREHLEDLPELAEHLVNRFCEDHPVELSPDVLDLLQGYHWPGNVRELAHLLEQSYIVGRGKISAEQLNLPGQLSASGSPGNSFKSAVEQTERELLLRALKEHGGNKTRAARQLGMRPSTFRDKLIRYNLD